MNRIAFVLAFSLCLPWRGEGLEAHDRAGDVYTLTFDSSTEMELVEVSFLVDGEDDAMGGGDDMSQTVARTRHVVVTDTIESAADGAATVFTRDYVEVGASHALTVSMPMGEDIDEALEQDSELEGLGVRFTVQPDGSFRPEFVDGEGDEALLDGLDAHLGLRALIAGGSAVPGESWAVDVDVLNRLRQFGGELRLEGEGDDMEGPAGSADRIELEGDVTAKCLRTVERDGRTLAEIEMKVDVSGFDDLTDEVEFEDDDPEDFPEGAIVPEIDSLELDLELEGTGSLWWNVTDGRVHVLELELDVTQTQTIRMRMPEEMGAGEMEQIMRMEGETRCEVRCDD